MTPSGTFVKSSYLFFLQKTPSKRVTGFEIPVRSAKIPSLKKSLIILISYFYRHLYNSGRTLIVHGFMQDIRSHTQPRAHTLIHANTPHMQIRHTYTHARTQVHNIGDYAVLRLPASSTPILAGVAPTC